MTITSNRGPNNLSFSPKGQGSIFGQQQMMNSPLFSSKGGSNPSKSAPKRKYSVSILIKQQEKVLKSRCLIVRIKQDLRRGNMVAIQKQLKSKANWNHSIKKNSFKG